MEKNRLSLSMAIVSLVILGLAALSPFLHFFAAVPEAGIFVLSVISLIPSASLLFQTRSDRPSVYTTLIFTVFAALLSAFAWLENSRNGYVFFDLERYLAIEIAVLAAFTGALLSAGQILTNPRQVSPRQSLRLPKAALLGALFIWLLALNLLMIKPFSFFSLDFWVVLLALLVYATTVFFVAFSSEIGRKRLVASGCFALLALPLYYYLRVLDGDGFALMVGDPAIAFALPSESTALLLTYLMYPLMAPLSATGVSALLAMLGAKYRR